MQTNLAWKWIAATALLLVLAAIVFLPTRHKAYAANSLYSTTAYASDDPDIQALKLSPFPEKPASRRIRPVETPSPDNP